MHASQQHLVPINGSRTYCAVAAKGLLISGMLSLQDRQNVQIIKATSHVNCKRVDMKRSVLSKLWSTYLHIICILTELQGPRARKARPSSALRTVEAPRALYSEEVMRDTENDLSYL